MPYPTVPLYEWCNERGLDPYEYSGLYFNAFEVAKMQSRGVSRLLAFRQKVENNLPLSGCEVVDDPLARPNEDRRPPKAFLAPQDLEFELTTTYEYEQTDEWGDQLPGAPTKSITETFLGEYLYIYCRSSNGELVADITVREKPYFEARPIFRLGGGMMGPSEDEMIRLPSRFDPEKDGAYVAFPRHEGWDITYSGDKLEGRYGEVSVRLVPYQHREDTELYVADFGADHEFALDDFIYFEEAPVLPPGYWYYPLEGGGSKLMYNPVLTLTLPPIDRDDWTNLWYDHGIMIKLNPSVTTHESRFVTIDLSRRLSATDQIKRFNRLQKEGKVFQRILVLRNVGEISLKDIVKTANTREVAPDEEDIPF